MPKRFQKSLADDVIVPALKNVLDAQQTNGQEHTKDVGVLIDQLFRAAGYELQLHQHGIAGTSLIAVELHPEIVIEVTEIKQIA